MPFPQSSLSIKRFQPRPSARLRLFCFPWAGLGASAFFRWSEQLPAEIEVVALQYPGREDRLRETRFRRLTPLLDLLSQDVMPCLDRPFAFWGHSMGALLAFELARRLAREGGPMPAHLFISGRQAPQRPEPLEPIENLPDAEFADELHRRYQGIPDAILRNPDIRDIFLPTIRADLELVYTHVHQPGPRLDCGISVFGGADDHVTRADLDAWQTHTAGVFRVYVLPGDHFFVTTQTATVLRYVVADLRKAFPSVFP